MKIYSIDRHNLRESIFPTSIVDTIIRSISDYLLPEQVFDDSALAEWAESNGYKKIQTIKDAEKHRKEQTNGMRMHIVARGCPVG